MSYLPSAPTSVRYGYRGLWVLLGIGGGLRITTDDVRSNIILQEFLKSNFPLKEVISLSPFCPPS